MFWWGSLQYIVLLRHLLGMLEISFIQVVALLRRNLVPHHLHQLGLHPTEKRYLYYSISRIIWSVEIISRVFLYSTGIKISYTVLYCNYRKGAPLSPTHFEIIYHIIIQNILYLLWIEKNVCDLDLHTCLYTLQMIR